MLRTVLLLIGALVLVPLIALHYDAPLSAEQTTPLRSPLLPMLGSPSSPCRERAPRQRQ